MVEFDRQYNKILVKRKRRSIKRRLFIVFKIFLLIIFFAVLVWGFNYFYNSSYFKINSIIVEGNQKYNEEEIKKAAEIILGANIFEIDKKYAEDRLIKELVWLKDVNLKKVFPDKIEIKVSERNPFVKAAYGGSWYIIDEEGVVLDKIFAGIAILPCFSILLKDHHLIPISRSVEIKFKKFFSVEIKILLKIGKLIDLPVIFSIIFIPSFNLFFKIVTFIFFIIINYKLYFIIDY